MAEPRPVILFVDDDEDYREAIRAILESSGYEMIGASSAEEGIRRFRERPADLVLVDMMMEEVDSGTTFVKELKALGEEVPIYLLSSVGETLSVTTDTTALGLAGIFQKPIDASTLVNVLRSRLGS